jgi:RNA polymerase sigma-70 factor (ECF subfamily)
MNAAALESPDCSQDQEYNAAASNESLLLDYAENGNLASFEQLVQRFQREILNYLRRYFGDEHLAEDAFQGSFLLLQRKCRQFEPGRQLRPWLYRIVTNHANDLLRRNRRHRFLSLDATLGESGEGTNGPLLDILVHRGQQPGEACETAEESQMISSAVERLPNWLKEPIFLVVYQGLKYHEAAKVIGIPLGTFKSRFAAGMKRLAAASRTVELARA